MAKRKPRPKYLKPEQTEAEDAKMYHGGMVRTLKPLENHAHGEHSDHAECLVVAIETGLLALESRSTVGSADVERVQGAPIQLVDYFDVETGDFVTVWRVDCRETLALRRHSWPESSTKFLD